MRTKLLLAILTLFLTGVSAKNTVTSVSQVTSGVTIMEDVDYTITGATPFTTSGLVNIVNTDHAVVIIQKIRPSVVIKNWLKYVQINGVAAKDGENCQVKMYNLGTIILPYDKNIHPLTCYTEEDYGGDSYNAYSEGTTDGFMKSIGAPALNNRIKSFKLKRGYMVTFATGKSGWGYSRCFIAANEDLEVPAISKLTNGKILNAKISSYRLFKWQNFSKKGVHDESVDANTALRTEWCFGWAAGYNMLPDVENVPHHIYEDWPSAAECGKATWSCHMQTNNEPGNSADDRPQDVETVLNNWQNLMRTGMRLCSESSHDGSMNHLKTFIQEIDKRGWRCDILDLHCYWDTGTFNSLTWYSDNYGAGRPIWISEWVWGASWNNNGAFASGRRSDNATYDGTVPILNVLNSNTRVERYAYWNSEQDFTKIWRGGSLTKLGKYYADMNTELGYKPSNEFVPKLPEFKELGTLTGTFTPSKKLVELSFTDPNHELADKLCIQMKGPGDTTFKDYITLDFVDQTSKDDALYTPSFTLDGEPGMYTFRVQATLGTAKKSTNEFSCTISAIKETGLIRYGYMTVPSSDNQSVVVNLGTGNTPAAFFGPVSDKNAFGKSVRTNNSTASTVTFNVYPFAQKDGSANTLAKAETVDFIFIPDGDYKFSGKRVLVARDAIRTLKNVEQEIKFATPFPEGVTPVVYVTRRSNSSNTQYASEPHVYDITNEGFKVIMMRQDAVTGTFVTSYASYIAMEPGEIYIGQGLKIVADYPSVEQIYTSGALKTTVTPSYDLYDPTILAGPCTIALDGFYTYCMNNVKTEAADVNGNKKVTNFILRRFVDASHTYTTSISSTKEPISYIAISRDLNGNVEDPALFTKDATTGVDEIEDNQKAQGITYTLSGQKVDANATLPSGVYIRNGRKVAK